MLPRWHVLLGAIFTLLIWIISPDISLVYLSLIFLSSFLIDFDHYLNAAIKTKKIGLFNAFNYHKKMQIKISKLHKRGIRKKADFHIFHTLEFHILTAILGAFFVPFFYIFLGMVFHSLLDILWMMKNDMLYLREFFFFNWAKKNFI